MAFTVQDGVNLRDQVTTLTQQLDTLMRQNEAITGAFDNFRAVATREIEQLRTQVAASGGGGGAADAKPLVKLTDLKDFKPETFSGKRDQDYKPWRKKFLTYCNMQCPGFRAALNWVEKLDTAVDDAALQRLAWDKTAEANPKLWDFLTLVCTDDALALVESVKEQGLEAWRLLHKRFASTGGTRVEQDE